MPSRRDVIGGTIGLATAASVARAGPVFAAPDRGLLERLDADLRRHASFGDKLSGSPGDLATAEWIGSRLKESGFAVDRMDFPVPTFAPAVARIQLGDTSIEVAPQPIVVPTPANGIRAQAALVRDMFEARGAAGCIAFIVLPFDRHAAIFSATIQPLLDATARSGPKAIVIVTTGPTGLITALNTKLQPMAPVPIALMAPRDLPAIAAAVAANRPVTLTVTGKSGTGMSCNMIATRRAGPKWLAFSTPRSGWYSCVGERGPGTAAFLELCRWAAVRYPRHSLFAINSGGHELDFIGTHHALSAGPPPGDTLIWTHFGAGLATRDRLDLGVNTLGMMATADPQRVMMVSPALMDDARRVFRGLAGYEMPVEVIGGAGELSTIIKQGYVRAFAGLGVHRWCHTVDDTLERVDAGLLLPVVEAHRALVELTIGQLASSSGT